jgi:hypothetical protein
MTVVGLATTNAADAIRPLCDHVVGDYTALLAADIDPHQSSSI